MDKREKVIKGLECCIIRHPDDKARCNECPYESACCNRLKMDALALLKAQEAQLVIVSRDYIEGTVLRCPKCKEVVHKYNGNYCPHCGQAVKWE